MGQCYKWPENVLNSNAKNIYLWIFQAVVNLSFVFLHENNVIPKNLPSGANMVKLSSFYYSKFVWNNGESRNICDLYIQSVIAYVNLITFSC
jgi:hypothetical protein